MVPGLGEITGAAKAGSRIGLRTLANGRAAELAGAADAKAKTDPVKEGVKKQRNKPPAPSPQAGGRPHSFIERSGPKGKYTTHNGDGTFKQFRGSGKSRGDIPRPNVKENVINRSPDGREFLGKGRVRPVRPGETPSGN